MGSKAASGAAEERGKRDPDVWGGDVSIILTSAYVCLCVTEHRRGNLMDGVCVCICADVLQEGRGGGASGERREMKRMSVPLRKCHTGKICRF